MLIQKLYAIEAELRKKTDGTAEDRREYRQQHSQPVMQQLYEWLNQHHLTVPSSSPTAKAINYTLKRWPALSRYLDDGNHRFATIGSRIRCVPGRWDARTGCLQVRCAVVSERQTS